MSALINPLKRKGENVEKVIAQKRDKNEPV